MTAGVVKKAAISQDSPPPVPATIPESPTSSPGEQKPKNDVGANSGNPPPQVKVEVEDSPVIKVAASSPVGSHPLLQFRNPLSGNMTPVCRT